MTEGRLGARGSGQIASHCPSFSSVRGDTKGSPYHVLCGLQEHRVWSGQHSGWGESRHQRCLMVTKVTTTSCRVQRRMARLTGGSERTGARTEEGLTCPGGRLQSPRCASRSQRNKKSQGASPAPSFVCENRTETETVCHRENLWVPEEAGRAGSGPPEPAVLFLRVLLTVKKHNHH